MKGAALETAMERYGKMVSLNRLRVSSSGALAAGREKEGELQTTSLEFEFHFFD